MIISILTDPNVGGTFLSWSLHFLAGHDFYFNADQKKISELPSSPLTNINAHKFLVNFPATESQFNEMYSTIKNETTQSFHTLYLHNLKTDHLGQISECEHTTRAVKQLQEELDKVIIVHTSVEHNLYFLKFEDRSLRVKFNSDEYNKDFEEQHLDFINTFFKEDKDKWNSLGLVDKWDHREFLALNLRPYEQVSMLPNVNLTLPHFRLNSFDLYNQFDKTVYQLFEYLEIPIDQDRYNIWLDVYKKWRNIQSDRVLFVEYFECIISSIINNYYLDLSRFNLDVIREAVIQHELIYKYNLTLKTWGVEKFPDNTQDLHKLLEPNVYHKVENIYGVL
jgi:hypothetical protein